MRVRFVDVEGVQTRCIYAGREDAYPIVLIHGMTFNAEIWIRNIDALAEHYFIVAPDLLGHGFSGPVKVDSRSMIERKVQHLSKLVEALGFDRFCACGSSYGGLVASLLYFSHPNKVDSLIINGSGSAFNDESQLVSNLTRMLDNVKPYIACGSTEQWRERLAHGFYDRTKVPEEMATSVMTSFAQQWPVDVWEQSIREMIDVETFRKHRIQHRLSDVNANTLIVWGRQDVGAKYAAAVDAVRQMPSATLLTIEECGHFPMIEHPRQYNRHIINFLKSSEVTY